MAKQCLLLLNFGKIVFVSIIFINKTLGIHKSDTAFLFNVKGWSYLLFFGLHEYLVVIQYLYICNKLLLKNPTVF